MSELVNSSEKLLPDGVQPWGDDRLADTEALTSTDAVMRALTDAYGDNLGHLAAGYREWRTPLKRGIVTFPAEYGGAESQLREPVRVAVETNRLPVLLEALGKRMPRLDITAGEKPIALSALAMTRVMQEVENDSRQGEMQQALLSILQSIGIGPISKRTAGATYEQLALTASTLFVDFPVLFARYRELASMIPDAHMALTNYNADSQVDDQFDIGLFR